MRLRPLLFALVAGAVALSAQAQPGFDEAREHFKEELDRQCPEKQLELLSAAQLRDGLDSYMSGLADDARAKFQQAETANCSSLEAGAACVNLADITAADQAGQMPDLVGSLCATFIRCRQQDVCDQAE
jgi:hypothetical protein